MAQFIKGDTFTDGEQVTGARLNQLVDSAALSVGAILDQPNITAGTVASNDAVLLYDLSATALREANVSDILGSNLPISTSSITGGAGVDLVLTPASGREVDIAGNFQVIGNSITTGTASVGGTFGVTGNVTASANLTVNGTTNLVGIPTAPTASVLTNTTQVATTAFVRADNNVKAWVNFNGTGTVAIRASFNVSSITDNGVGDYTINFTTAISDSNYAVVNSCTGRNAFTAGLHTAVGAWASAPTTKTTTAARIAVSYSDANLYDLNDVSVAILR